MPRATQKAVICAMHSNPSYARKRRRLRLALTIWRAQSGQSHASLAVVTAAIHVDCCFTFTMQLGSFSAVTERQSLHCILGNPIQRTAWGFCWPLILPATSR